MYPDTNTDSLTSLSLQRPQVLMAGPCSAETETQVLAVAEALSQSGIDYFRAGIWKPRTNPGNFEGVGEIGLNWLNAVQKNYKLKVATEIATPQHLELALKYGVDMVWIGARTSVNPFSVQEIANALEGVQIPVMIKNPINPDLALWMGAIQRIQKAGIQEIIACHRGFNVYHKTLYRNAPLWEIPLELKRRMPEVPLICDPSHICGTREYLANIAQKAMDLGLNGLILETHNEPDKAWSDAAQQLTPAAFIQLIQNLRYRKTSTSDIVYNSRLQNLRQEVDEIDVRLVELFAARLEAARKIGELKNASGITFFQHNRWTEVLENSQKLAKQLGISEDFISHIFNQLHLEALEIQGE